MAGQMFVSAHEWIITDLEFHHEVKDNFHYLIVKHKNNGYPIYDKIIYDEGGLKALTGSAFISYATENPNIRRRERLLYSCGDATLLNPEEVSHNHNPDAIKTIRVGVDPCNGQFAVIGEGKDKKELSPHLRPYIPPMMRSLLAGKLPILWALD